MRMEKKTSGGGGGRARALAAPAVSSPPHLLGHGLRVHGAAAAARPATPAPARHELGQAAGPDLFEGGVVHLRRMRFFLFSFGEQRQQRAGLWRVCSRTESGEGEVVRDSGDGARARRAPARGACVRPPKRANERESGGRPRQPASFFSFNPVVALHTRTTHTHTLAPHPHTHTDTSREHEGVVQKKKKTRKERLGREGAEGRERGKRQKKRSPLLPNTPSRLPAPRKRGGNKGKDGTHSTHTAHTR